MMDFRSRDRFLRQLDKYMASGEVVYYIDSKYLPLNEIFLIDTREITQNWNLMDWWPNRDEHPLLACHPTNLSGLLESCKDLNLQPLPVQETIE
jgi:hypothetical protein